MAKAEETRNRADALVAEPYLEKLYAYARKLGEILDEMMGYSPHYMKILLVPDMELSCR